jgi:hypothetical protein
MTTFMSKLGFDMILHKSSLASSKIYLSKQRPNLPERSSMSNPLAPESTESGPVASSLSVSFDANCTKISSLQLRFDIVDETWKDVLREGAAVTLQQPSIYSLRLSLGANLIHTTQLPLPIASSDGANKTRIARKSSWVEYTTPVASPADLLERPESLYPINLHKRYLNIPNCKTSH